MYATDHETHPCSFKIEILQQQQSAANVHLSQEEEANIRKEIEDKIRKEVEEEAIKSPPPPPPPPLFSVVSDGSEPRLLSQIRDFEGTLRSIVRIIIRTQVR